MWIRHAYSDYMCPVMLMSSRSLTLHCTYCMCQRPEQAFIVNVAFPTMHPAIQALSFLNANQL